MSRKGKAEGRVCKPSLLMIASHDTIGRLIGPALTPALKKNLRQALIDEDRGLAHFFVTQYINL